MRSRIDSRRDVRRAPSRHGRFAACVGVLVTVVALAGCGTSGGKDAASSPAIDDAQANDAYYQCLLDAGVPATRDDDGNVAIRAGDEAEEKKYDDVEKQCKAKLENAGTFESSNDANLDREYETLTALHTCLVDAGFPLSNWPTKEVFAESDGSVNVLDSTAAFDEKAARQACPEQFQAVDSL